MSDTQSPIPEQPVPQRWNYSRYTSRGALVFFSVMLLLIGGVIGAKIGAHARPWHPHMGFGPGGHYAMPYGPDWRMDARMHRPDFGRAFFPGTIEHGVNAVLDDVNASSEQKQKVRAIAEKAADDIFALRQKHRDGRKQIAEALTAETIDRAKIESLRAEQMKLAESATKRLSDAAVDAVEVLTPAQREALGKRLEDRGRWFRG